MNTVFQPTANCQNTNCLTEGVHLNLYLLIRPDWGDPAIDFVGFRRRLFRALLSHLYRCAIGQVTELLPGLGGRVERWR
jgi:hypothetical protein